MDAHSCIVLTILMTAKNFNFQTLVYSICLSVFNSVQVRSTFSVLSMFFERGLVVHCLSFVISLCVMQIVGSLFCNALITAVLDPEFLLL